MQQNLTKGINDAEIYSQKHIININDEGYVTNQEYQINEFLTFLSIYGKRQLKKNERIIVPISLITTLLPIPFDVIETSTYVNTLLNGSIYLKVLFQSNIYCLFVRNIFFAHRFFDKLLSVFIDDRPKQEQLATGHKGSLFLNIKSRIPRTRNKFYKTLLNTTAYVGFAGFMGIILPESLSFKISTSTFISKNTKVFFQSVFSNIIYTPEIFGESIFSIDLIIDVYRYLREKYHIKPLNLFHKKDVLIQSRKAMTTVIRDEIIKNLERYLMIYRMTPEETRRNRYQNIVTEIYNGVDQNNLSIAPVIQLLHRIKQTEDSIQSTKRTFNKKMIFSTALVSILSTFAMFGAFELDSGFNLIDKLSLMDIFSISTFLAYLAMNLTINTKFSKDFVGYLFNLPRQILYFIRYKSGDFPVIFQKKWKILTPLALFTAVISLSSFLRYHSLFTWYPIVKGGLSALLFALPVIPVYFSILWDVTLNVFKYLFNFFPTSIEDKREIMGDKLIESILHYMRVSKRSKLLQLISSLEESQLEAIISLENPELKIAGEAYSQYNQDYNSDSLYRSTKLTLFSNDDHKLSSKQTIQLVKKLYETHQLEKGNSYDEERIPLRAGRNSNRRDSGREFARRSRCLVM